MADEIILAAAKKKLKNLPWSLAGFWGAAEK
jgi:hypothetical protein